MGFRYRFGITGGCAAANQPALAKGVFGAPKGDVACPRLERWEPVPGVGRGRGLVLCYRALAKAGGKLSRRGRRAV